MKNNLLIMQMVNPFLWQYNLNYKRDTVRYMIWFIAHSMSTTEYHHVHKNSNNFAPFIKERGEVSDKWRRWPLGRLAYPPQLMKRLPPGGMLASGRNNSNILNSTSHPSCTYTHHYRGREGAFIQEKDGGRRYWPRQIRFSKIPWWLYMSTREQKHNERQRNIW